MDNWVLFKSPLGGTEQGQLEIWPLGVTEGWSQWADKGHVILLSVSKSTKSRKGE